jgi:hypothetical protein
MLPESEAGMRTVCARSVPGSAAAPGLAAVGAGQCQFCLLFFPVSIPSSPPGQRDSSVFLFLFLNWMRWVLFWIGGNAGAGD